ncbi:MAG: SpoIIE family protein phosphatase [Thermoanaerobaculia bacterium]|nr:SpoIIE family protein phosphatase [Thermoanaerobaculia bacterium]
MSERTTPSPDARVAAAGSQRARRGPEEALACLLEVTQVLNATTDLGSGLERVAQIIKRFVPFETFSVLLIDDLGQELRFAYAEGFPPHVIEHWRFGMGQGIVGTAAAGRTPVRVDDARADSRYINASPSVRSELAIPLLTQNRTVGVLDIGGPEPDFFTLEDERLLGFLADHLAAAIERMRLYENLREQATTLSLLHEVSRELTSILNRKRLLRRVAVLVKRLIDYDLFTVYLWSPESQLLEPSIALYRDGPRLASARAIPLGHGIAGSAAALRQPLRVPNVQIDPRYVKCVDDLEVASELAVPLVFKDRLLGVLNLESVRFNAFSNAHQQLLSTLGSSLAIALENAHLYEQLRLDEHKLETDLSTAREVQKQLLPKSTPWVPGLQVAVAYEPARHLAGDFYEFIPYGEGRVAIAVGDVAGKATSAALFGSLVIGMLREYVGENHVRPAHVLKEMNRKLGRLGFDSRFLAMAFAVYDPADRSLLVANSGLPYPFLLRGRSVKRIEVGGVPLGLLPDREYEEVPIRLEEGESVVIASDGVEECLDLEENEFGEERIARSLRGLADGKAMQIADGLMAATRRFAAGAEVSDDRTIVVLKAVATQGGTGS